MPGFGNRMQTGISKVLLEKHFVLCYLTLLFEAPNESAQTYWIIGSKAVVYFPPFNMHTVEEHLIFKGKFGQILRQQKFSD
jgi:hypothetical protein